MQKCSEKCYGIHNIKPSRGAGHSRGHRGEAVRWALPVAHTVRLQGPQETDGAEGHSGKVQTDTQDRNQEVVNKAKKRSVLSLVKWRSELGEKYGVGKVPWKEVCWLEPLEEAALVGVTLTIEPERGLGQVVHVAGESLEAGEGTGSVRQRRRKP